MDFDQDRIYFAHQNLAASSSDQNGPNNGPSDIFEYTSSFNSTTQAADINPSAVRRHLREFLRNYRIGNRYIYRNKLLNTYRRHCRQNANFEQNSNEHTTTQTAAGSQSHASIEIDLAHVSEYDSALLGLLLHRPANTLPLFEAAALDCLKSVLYSMHQSNERDNEMEDDMNAAVADDSTAMGGEGRANGVGNTNNGRAMDEEHLNSMGEIQVLLCSNAGGSSSQSSTYNTSSSGNSNSGMMLQPTDLRRITAKHMNQLLLCPGIVISAARIRSRAHRVRIRCTRCGDSRTLTTQSFTGVSLPMNCMGPEPAECKQAPYEVVPDECQFIDQQTLKVQEAPELVPTGEMPRTILVAAERSLVDSAPPGTRVQVMGIVSLFNMNAGSSKSSKRGANVRQIYLRAVGMSIATAHGSSYAQFTPAEEEAFRELARRPDIYQVLSQSIAPSISGKYTVDIKKALACQLMSGSQKRLPDGMRLRGDVNVLLMGDPSTAKSQFLKFIEKVAPVGVYTSGKGSSAAGLTASVVRDRNGEFYLEGGAMVLADGGIVCIDEFDKMRPQDRVSIHEAMEQQTISVAKAGITTVLNSRCSVLAAANPVFGRYDDLRSASENIDLMTTILSRFDMIFIVRDVREEERDKAICRHVMGVHINSNNQGSGSYGSTSNGTTTNTRASLEASFTSSSADQANDIAEQAMRVAKAWNASSGNEESVRSDSELDIKTMKKFVQYCRAKCAPRLSDEASEVLESAYVKIRDDVRKRNEAQTVPITVRQLEALVRISESLAKMRLSAEVSPDDVTEALRLFRVSTMTASAADDKSIQDSISGGGDDIRRSEAFLKSRVTIGATVNKQRIIEEATSQGFDTFSASKAIAVMVLRGELQEKSQGRLVKRLM